MARDYVPAPDGDFRGWENGFVSEVNADKGDLGLVASDVPLINVARASWTTDYPAQTAAQAARQPKNDAHAGLEGAIRPLVRRLRACPDADHTSRPAMGITMPDRKGSPPTVRGQLTFLAVDPDAPSMTDFDGAEARETAHDVLRRVRKTGEKGPWSETASATAGA